MPGLAGVLRALVMWAYVAAVAGEGYPVQWTGRQAVVSVPEHLDVSNAGQLSEQLLLLINRGAAELIVDMTGTVSCDYAGADAAVRAYQRAAASGTQLRLVVAAAIVRRVLTVNGLDRLIPMYPSLEAATAAAAPAAVSPGAGLAPDAQDRPRRPAQAGGQRLGAEAPGGPDSAGITRAVLRGLIDALADGVVLADNDGALVLVNRRLEEMFGYARGELAGRTVECLLPADLREAHRGHRAGYARAPRARIMGEGARLVGVRKDGATFPVSVSLTPVPTATGHLILAVVRDVTEIRRGEDLVGLAQAAAATGQAQRSRELLDQVTASLFEVGVSLQAAIDLPHHLARQRITAALQRLDDTICQIRGHVFTTGPAGTPKPMPRGGAG
jgi:anti-anti-sigma factor